MCARVIMASITDKKKLLYKLAKAYYEDNLTQGEIGKRFGLSRIKVSRLLQQARDEKIVQITIIPPQEPNAELERKLESRYGLDEAVIVFPSSYDKEAIVQELGPPAAERLLRSLQGNEVISISWGTTLLAVVESLPPQTWSEMKVVQMLGGLGRPESETYGADLVHRMAQIFGARPRMIPAPGIVTNKLVRDALLTDPQISDTLALAAQAHAAMVGIGRPTPGSVVMESGILSEKALGQLEALGAVGDIALRFFDAYGQAVQHEICDRIIGLDLEQIKKIPRVMGVAGGEEKYEVIRAALRGKLVNVLVTDDQTAIHLLAEPEEPLNSAPELTDVVTSQAMS
jgi:DNA-binding transcriptional regulator LsrR (DeoR family)